MLKRNLNHKILKHANDSEGRILLLDVEIQENIYTIGSVYAPTQDKPQNQLQFLDKLDSLLDTMDADNVLLGGDFNCLLDPSLDKNSQNPSPSTTTPYRNRIL